MIRPVQLSIMTRRLSFYFLFFSQKYWPMTRGLVSGGEHPGAADSTQMPNATIQSGMQS